MLEKTSALLQADGECPKLVANKPVVDRDGTWYLAVRAVHAVHALRAAQALGM